MPRHPSALFALEISVWQMPPANFGGFGFGFSLHSDPNRMQSKKSTRSTWASRRRLGARGAHKFDPASGARTQVALIEGAPRERARLHCCVLASPPEVTRAFAPVGKPPCDWDSPGSACRRAGR